MKTVVLSGVNMTEGGILTIFRNAIEAFSLQKEIKLICLVHSVELFDKKYLDNERITFVAFPNIKKSWLKRIFFEYCFCYKLSKKLKADIWISLHDMTSRVIANKQYVYCHNPSPFYKATKIDFKFNKKFWLFTFFYKYLYRINIKRNEMIIVQQTWIANAFKHWFNINNICISKPVLDSKYNNIITNDIKISSKQKKIILLYPSYPRTFKNFEVLIDTFSELKKRGRTDQISLFLTFDENTNKYAKYLVNKCKNLELESIHFVGFLDQRRLNDYYKCSDIVIFPSKLETWGLPITEAKSYNKRILLADLPYAHETLGNYDKAKFFSADSSEELSNLLVSMLNGNNIFTSINYNIESEFIETNNWKELVQLILK